MPLGKWRRAGAQASLASQQIDGKYLRKLSISRNMFVMVNAEDSVKRIDCIYATK